MDSQGHEHLDRGLHSYPCARLKNLSRQTFWRYPLGTALLSRQYTLGTVLSRTQGNARSILYCTRYRTSQRRPPRSSRLSAKLSRSSPRRCKSKVTIDVMKGNTSSESQWSGSALTGTKTCGASEGSARHPLALTHRLIFFGPEARTIPTFRSPHNAHS